MTKHPYRSLSPRTACLSVRPQERPLSSDAIGRSENNSVYTLTDEVFDQLGILPMVILAKRRILDNIDRDVLRFVIATALSSPALVLFQNACVVPFGPAATVNFGSGSVGSQPRKP